MPLNLKEMQQAYEIRAPLEEVAGRAAAQVLNRNTAALRRELDAMRAAFSRLDLDSLGKHDIAFHRTILQASQNEVLLRVWDSLAVDLRMQAVIGRISGDFPEMVESHHTIVDALENGRGREAGLLLRNHIETVLEFLKKSESDSELHRVLRNELEEAKEVHKAFFPEERVLIPGPTCETFSRSVRGIGAFPWRETVGESRLETSLARESVAHYSWPASRPLFGHRPCRCTPSFPHLWPMLIGWFSPVHQNISMHRFSMRNTSGTALGLLPCSQFSCHAFQIEDDDLLVAYTDGITESENACGEPWGSERLETLLRACHDSTPRQVVHYILDEVSNFAQDRFQVDDMTLVVIPVKEGSGI